MKSNKKFDNGITRGKETLYKDSTGYYVWLDGYEKDPNKSTTKFNKLSNYGGGSLFCAGSVLVTGNAKLVSCSVHSRGRVFITSTRRSEVEGLTAYGVIDAMLTQGSLRDVSVKGRASVYGNSHLSNVELEGDTFLISCNINDAYIIGTCTLRNAKIESQRDIVQITGIGREEKLLTVYRAKNGKIWCSRGCFQGSLEEFLRRSKRVHTPQQRQGILAALQYAKLRMNADFRLPSH